MKKGFTLLEVILIIVILGVLATLISGNFITSLKKGRDARRKADLEQIQRALEMYYEDKKAYPTSISFGDQLIDPASGKIYMQKIPNDPSGGNYKYVYDSTNNGYKLYACLENTQQVLPYASGLNPGSNFTCNTLCFAQDRTTRIICIWGISSSNTNP